MNLEEVLVFLTVVSTGSLARAARHLDVPSMTASRRLAALEKTLGVRLIHRTTRSLSLTSEGESFWPYAQSMIESQQAGFRAIRGNDLQATGMLRVTAPTGFGQRFILPLIPVLIRDHPSLQVDLQLSEDVIDIAGRGLDLAIRIAPLQNSNLIASRLVDNPRVLCASPEYLSRFGIPTTVAELDTHACIRLSNLSHWSFSFDNDIRNIRISGKLSCSSVEGVRSLCLAGQGIAQLTYWDVRDELANGTLQVIDLIDAQRQQLAIWAMMTSRHYRPRRVTVFIEMLKNRLATSGIK